MRPPSVDLQEITINAIATAAELPRALLEHDVDVSDLGLDSVDFWEILLDIEDQTGVEVPAEILQRLAELDSPVTVGDLVDAFGKWDLGAGPSAHA
jgi:acyl carrier protein